MIKKDNFGTRSNSKLAASGPIKAGTTNANLGGKSVVARANTPAQDPNLGRLVLTTIIQDIPKYSINGEGAQVAINYTSLQIPKEKELKHPLIAGIQVSLVSGNFSQLITITSTLALNDTTISVASFNPNVDIGKGALICIDEEDLFNQYQNKTKGTIAGFTVDSDGIAKSGIEITDWLNSDTMTGASVNNVPTALSVKNYVDNSHPAEDQTLQEVTDNGNTTTNSVMIGSTSSPTSKLYVKQSDYASSSTPTVDDTLTIERDGSNYLNIIANGANYNSGILFSDDARAIGQVLYNHYGDYMRFVTNGTEQMRITSTGNVGIGTTSPVHKLDIKGTPLIGFYKTDGTYLALIGEGSSAVSGGGANDFGIRSGISSSNILFAAGGASEQMRITSAGNVGIGTTSPSAKLEVVSARGAEGIHLNDGSFPTVGKVMLDVDANGDGEITLRNSNSQLTSVISGGESSYLMGGNVGIGTTSPSSTLNINGGTGSLSTGLTFGDGDTGIWESADDVLRFSTASTTRVLIDSSGNVGIGTTSPYQKLGVNGNIQIGNQGASAGFVIFNGTNVGLWNYENGYIRLGTNGAERLRITDAGNVGIGSTSPNRLLTLSASGGTYQAFNSTSNNNTTIGSDGTGAFVVYDDTASSYRMVVKASTGNVLIGTTTDSGAKLNVVGGNLRVDNTGSTSDYSEITERQFQVTRSGSSSGMELQTLGTYSGSGGFIDLKPKNTTAMRIAGDGNVLIGTTTDSGEKLQVAGTGKFTGQVTIPATPVATTDAASKSYVDSQVAEAGTSSFGSFTPTSTQTIASGGNVGVKSTLLLATSQVTASNITTSSAGLTFANAGLYQISFNFASKVSGTVNRTLAAANLEYSTDGETWTEIVGSLVYNYDRGTATSGGASSWGFVYDGSASCSFIHNLATSSKIRARFWIEGRASSASGITTIINGCRLSAHKIG